MLSKLKLSDSKRCSKCLEMKPVSEFSKNKSNATGYAPCCKKCHYRIYSLGQKPTATKQDITVTIAMLNNLGTKYIEAARQLEAIARLEKEVRANIAI